MQRVSLMVVCFACLPFIVAGGWFFADQAWAQDNAGGWPDAQLLYRFEGEGQILEPAIVADQAGGVHLVWSVHDSRGDPPLQLIYYSQWDGNDWSDPVDIVVANQANSPSITADATGILHLIWHGSSDLLYYSRAEIENAHNAAGWTRPIALGQAHRHPSILSGRAGELYVAYGRKGSGHPTLQKTVDGGQTWSIPVEVAEVSGVNAAADYLRMAADADGALHMVWTEFELPNGWPPTGVFYTRSSDRGQSWSEAVELAGPGYDQISILALEDSSLHVAWNGMAGLGGRYHQMSPDAGLTWTETNIITPEGGTEGPPQLAADSSGQVHLLTTYSPCAWYGAYDGESWSELACISEYQAELSGYIEQPAMAVAGGNTLHAVFWDGRVRLWHSEMTTDADMTPPQKFEQSIISSTESVESEVGKPTSSANDPIQTIDLGDPPSINPSASLGKALATAVVASLVVFVGILAGVQAFRSSNR